MCKKDEGISRQVLKQSGLEKKLWRKIEPQIRKMALKSPESLEIRLPMGVTQDLLVKTRSHGKVHRAKKKTAGI